MNRVAEYTAEELEGWELSTETLPRHIAIIMDGNGRWAQAQGLPRIEGHRRGVKSVRQIVEECSKFGIEQLTLYCLSSENWKRPEQELNLLLQLLEQYVIEERSEIMRQDIRFTIIGRRDGLGESTLSEVQKTIETSSKNKGMTLCLALNYGSRGEIVDAMKSISQKVADKTISIDEINEETISSHLYTAGMPDPDLLIRTAGEMRLSNYLLWQISYAELWVTEVCWPAFGRAELLQALTSFTNRTRRFGGLNES
ncbi:Undecaprenyl diphosphate synthase [hydrothermal vent metagenome]|uniref:Undecaprenyl diphosphate synthase n=1 Tax=hydrothermal vent metagenome TaxID=652676 RepID=A0A3B1DC98_9ZZZZ